MIGPYVLYLCSITSPCCLGVCSGSANSVRPSLVINNDMVSNLSKNQIESISGLTAGLSTTVITHPLDLIKVRLQLSNHHSNFKAFQSIVAEIINNPHQRVLTEFYRGLTPNLVGNVSGWSLYFTLYEHLKSNSNISNNTLNYFGSSTMAGLLTSALTNPIWVLKTRLMDSNQQYKSLWDAIYKMYKFESPLVFWRGLVPSLFQVFQTGLQFTIYDHLKVINPSHPSGISGTTQLTNSNIPFYLLASSGSKFFAMLVMYPFQVLRSNLQKVDSNSFKSELVNLYRHNKFYNGFFINLFKVLPSTSITFITYELMKNYLNA